MEENLLPHSQEANGLQKTYLLEILRIVKYNSDVRSLIGLGLTYSQIAILLEKAIEAKYISRNEGGELNLSQIGLMKFKELKSNLTPDDWILPEEESRIEKKDKFDIYLPNREGISF